MSQSRVMARLAVRELWISFRLFGVIVCFVAAGSIVALLPSPLPRMMTTFAAALALATVLTAAVSAWSIAEERRAGRAGWLVTRSLSRGTLLVGWFVALGGTALLALSAAGTLGWLAASSVTLRLEPTGYVSLLGGVAATVLAAIALGLTAGIVLPAMAATLLATLASGAAMASCLLVTGDVSLLPGGAYVALASLTEPGAAIGPGLRVAGVGLACTALLLGLARLLLDRAEL